MRKKSIDKNFKVVDYKAKADSIGRVTISDICMADLKDKNTEDNVEYINSIQSLCFKFFDVNGIVYVRDLSLLGRYIIDWLTDYPHIDILASYTDGTMESVAQMGDFRTLQKSVHNVYRYTMSDDGTIYCIEIKYFKYVCRIFNVNLIIKGDPLDLSVSYDTKAPYTYGLKKYGDLLIYREILAEWLKNPDNIHMTVGSCCLANFKNFFMGKDEFAAYMGDLVGTQCPFTGYKNADDYIRQYYKGGWCYVKSEVQGKTLQKEGFCIDVNSLYPYVMHSVSGCGYPLGKPHFFKDAIPAPVYEKNLKGENKRVFFVHIKARFTLKEGYLPTVRARGDVWHSSDEWLTDSRTLQDGRYVSTYVDFDGKAKKIYTDLYLTGVEYALFHKHYKVFEEKVIDGVYFQSVKGIFDEYINFWYGKKSESTGAARQNAKLMLNSLGGKIGTSPEHINRVQYKNRSGELIERALYTYDTQSPGNVAISAMMTAYARVYTIQAAQANYSKFCYSDTDSIHCIGCPDDAVGVEIDDKKLGAWKIESVWSEAIFLRQKMYAEKVIDKNGVESYSIKMSGLGRDGRKEVREKLENGEIVLDNMRTGIEIGGNTRYVRTADGIVVKRETYYIK